MFKDYERRASRTQRKMKKAVKVVAFMLCLVMAISVLEYAGVYAKDRTPVTIIKEDYSEIVKGAAGKLTVECYIERLSLAGKTKAVKKINKTIKKLAYKYGIDQVFEYAEERVAEKYPIDDAYNVYRDTVDCDQTYNDGKTVSVRIFRSTNYGGVTNYLYKNGTFDLSTGKSVKITKASGKSLKYIKERLIGNFRADYGDEGTEEAVTYINSMKESQFNYYINGDGLCVVCFDSYDLAMGPSWYEYIIE